MNRIHRCFAALVLAPLALSLSATARAQAATTPAAPAGAGTAPPAATPVEPLPSAQSETPAAPATTAPPPTIAPPLAPEQRSSEPPAVATPPPQAPPTAGEEIERAVPPNANGSPLRFRIYGFLNAQIERAWARGGATPYAPRFRIADGGSRIGFTGSYVLAPGTRAVWQLEGALQGFEQGGFNDQGSPIVFTSRNTFVGLEDERFGRLLIGNVDSAYRSLVGSGGPMGGNVGLSVVGLDAWNNSDAQLTGNVDSIFSRGEARYKNSLHYFTPEWKLPLAIPASAQLAASYGFDEALSSGTTRGRYSIAGLFKLGGFALGGAYDRQANTGADMDRVQQGFGLRTHAENGTHTYFYKGVASFLFPTQTYVGVGVERSNYGLVELGLPSYSNYYATLVSSIMHQTGVMATLAQSIGQLTLIGSFGALLNLSHAQYGAASDYRALQYSLGAKYAFSENVGAYAFYSEIQNKPRQDVNLGTPVYSNDLGTSGAYLSPGDSPHAVAIALIARF